MARVVCIECKKEYDDTYRLTDCPHKGFEMHTVAVNSNGHERVCTTLEELEQHMTEEEEDGRLHRDTD